MFQNANCARFYNVQFELCERLESVQRASDLPAFPRRAEGELRPNTWAFHMSSVISTTLQLPFTPPFGLIILASLSVLLSCCVHHPPPASCQGSHILSKAQSEFVCGVYRKQCNHRGLSAGQMFRVSMQAWLNSNFSVVLYQDDWLRDSNPWHSRTATFSKWVQDSAGQKDTIGIFFSFNL